MWKGLLQTSPSRGIPYPALSFALSTKVRGWYISTSVSGVQMGWLEARLFQFCLASGLSPNHARVEESGVPLVGLYMGLMVLLYKPGLAGILDKKQTTQSETVRAFSTKRQNCIVIRSHRTYTNPYSHLSTLWPH